MNTTNDAFGEVAVAAGKVGELVGEIAAASDEQSQSTEQVSSAVAQMNQITQQNAANAEESASASEELNAQAEQMKTFVDELSGMIGTRGKAAATAGVRKRFAGKRGAEKNAALPKKSGGEISSRQLLALEEENFRNF